jgi:hypothetical protein
MVLLRDSRDAALAKVQEGDEEYEKNNLDVEDADIKA